MPPGCCAPSWVSSLGSAFGINLREYAPWSGPPSSAIMANVLGAISDSPPPMLAAVVDTKAYRHVNLLFGRHAEVLFRGQDCNAIFSPEKVLAPMIIKDYLKHYAREI